MRSSLATPRDARTCTRVPRATATCGWCPSSATGLAPRLEARVDEDIGLTGLTADLRVVGVLPSDMDLPRSLTRSPSPSFAPRSARAIATVTADGRCSPAPIHGGVGTPASSSTTGSSACTNRIGATWPRHARQPCASNRRSAATRGPGRSWHTSARRPARPSRADPRATSRTAGGRCDASILELGLRFRTMHVHNERARQAGQENPPHSGFTERPEYATPPCNAPRRRAACRRRRRHRPPRQAPPSGGPHAVH